MLSERIRKRAELSGIDIVGFTDASPFPDYSLHDSIRRDPGISLPEAQSIIVAGIYIGGLTLPKWENPQYGRTSRLYLSGFFLDIIKPLEPIARLLKDEGYTALICDSSTGRGSILPLKLAAVRAGFGWQGKNSLLLSKKYGSFLALGGIITDAVLEYNTEQEPNRCGNCNKCRQSYPLGALDDEYKLNREQCLSNILQEDTYPESAKQAAQNRIGDCEICQDVCPWNRKHRENPLQTKMTEKFNTMATLLQEKFFLPDLAKMTEQDYKTITDAYHTGIPFAVFHRNVLAAVDNMNKKV